MPSIARKNVAAATANALNGLKFSKIGPKGALLTLYASTPTAGGAVTFSGEGGDRLVCDAAELNIEGSADVVSTSDDLIFADEPMGPGDLFLSVEAQIGNFVLFIEEG